ncbi:right-handed parallel beta-helix repeat-containing protein, partial [candidate division KSB1 bacterium]|nr:right-handed parallel beta-helix repeat-containing protein [candidate division KSB1 bacterium]
MNIIKSHIFCMLILLILSPTMATTFYVDATAGSDTTSGATPELAWQTLDKLNDTTFVAGDTILFKAGERWTGSFRPRGSGSEEAPIIVDMYGEGERPVLDGAGEVNHVIRLENVDYWELYNLEITNNSDLQRARIGVYILANGGQRRHIHLRHLFIHHIMGLYTFEMIGKNTGGIGIIGNGNARFDDILIEQCEIGDIVRVGIFTNGNKGEPGGRPITNLVIRHNTIYRCAGDGAIIRYADKPIIEKNEVYENHNGDQALVQYGVALWTRSTDSAMVQYNHVYKTYGDMDGQAFDADLEAWGTVVQNNYSHDNEGGFMLVYGSSSDAIVRFNISQNDGAVGGHIFDFPVWTNPRGSG